MTSGLFATASGIVCCPCWPSEYNPRIADHLNRLADVTRN
jgi:hypothetical protein